MNDRNEFDMPTLASKSTQRQLLGGLVVTTFTSPSSDNLSLSIVMVDSMSRSPHQGGGANYLGIEVEPLEMKSGYPPKFVDLSVGLE